MPCACTCLQDNTPKPTKDVYLHSTPAATFFVSQFGGFAVDDITVSAKAAALVTKLKARGESFVESVFFSGADLPKTSLFGRSLSCLSRMCCCSAAEPILSSQVGVTVASNMVCSFLPQLAMTHPSA